MELQTKGDLVCVKNVLSIWRITCRRLGLAKSDRELFNLHVACRQHCCEQKAVIQIRKRFSQDWWESVLITDVSEIGELHMIDEEALYERD